MHKMPDVILRREATPMNNAFAPMPVEPVKRVSYRPAEAAEAMGVCEPTLFKIMKEDPTFPRVKHGRTVLIPVRELEKWLADRAKNESEVDNG